MQDRYILHFRACVKGLFYKNLDDYSMFNDTINTSVNPYYFLSSAKQNFGFSLILKLKEREKFNNCSIIYNDQEHQTLKHIHEKEWYITSHLPPMIQPYLTTNMAKL